MVFKNTITGAVMTTENPILIEGYRNNKDMEEVVAKTEANVDKPKTKPVKRSTK